MSSTTDSDTPALTGRLIICEERPPRGPRTSCTSGKSTCSTYGKTPRNSAPRNFIQPLPTRNPNTHPSWPHLAVRPWCRNTCGSPELGRQHRHIFVVAVTHGEKRTHRVDRQPTARQCRYGMNHTFAQRRRLAKQAPVRTQPHHAKVARVDQHHRPVRCNVQRLHVRQLARPFALGSPGPQQLAVRPDPVGGLVQHIKEDHPLRTVRARHDRACKQGVRRPAERPQRVERHRRPDPIHIVGRREQRLRHHQPAVATASTTRSETSTASLIHVFMFPPS